MMYYVEFTDFAKKQLEKLDKHTKKIIVSWIEKNIEGTTNPRQHGKALSANRVGQWRYRIGDYRVIVKIEDDKLIVLIIALGHRKEIYDL